MSWLDAVISYAGSYATKNAIRAISPVPNQSILVYCVESNSAWYWQGASAAADDGTTVLAPSNTIDSVKGRWLVAALGGSGGAVTLAGDTSGASGANVTSHVTGGADTHVHGTATVRLIANGVDTITADANGMLLKTTRVRTGSGAPSASDPDGSIYLRTDGTSSTTAYVRAAGAWVALASPAAVTLVGDASGDVGSNIVTHVTGTTATQVHGSSSVALVVDSSPIVTADASGMLLNSSRVRTGSGVPSAADTDGSLYLRTDGTGSTTVYARAGGAWSPLGATGGGTTLVGDATGDAGANTVVQLTGGTYGTSILRPSANPVDQPSGHVLQFPSKQSDLDSWRWLQSDGAASVSRGFYGTASYGSTLEMTLITFGPPNIDEMQGFFGTLHVLITPVDTNYTAFCEWKIPFHAFTWYVTTPTPAYSVKIHTVSTSSRVKLLNLYPNNGASSFFNSGFAWSGRNSSDQPMLFDTYSDQYFDRKLVSGAPYGSTDPNTNGSVYLTDDSDGSRGSVIATITPPESTLYESSWAGSFYNKAWRCRARVEGMWSLEPNRTQGTIGST